MISPISRKPQLLLALIGYLLTSFSVSIAAAPKPAAKKKQAEYKKPKRTRFLRVVRGEKQTPQSLETAIVRYVPQKGNGKLAVDLIGAVHIGDKSYYETLNKKFTEYDVVLYELVAPKGTRIKKGSRKQGPFGTIIKNFLKLESQVVEIDYTKKNFVHADMSFEEIGKAMKKRGESGLTVVASIMTDMFRESNRRAEAAAKSNRKLPKIDLATLLFDAKRDIKLKRLMAEQFDDLGEDGGLGKTLNVMLIKDRNAACLKVLEQQIKKGHKKIAIFYGAAHMPAFEKNLLADFGLKRQKVEWIKAWNLKD
ncbi:MAG: hypothetical protein Tsb009_32260 [Planctomycetaceae bacterium]